MNISISIESDNQQIISSGYLFARPDKPVRMTVFIDNEKTVSVMLCMCSEKHSKGKRILRNVSDDGTIDEWNIYESEDGEIGFTDYPVRVVCYEDAGVTKAVYLQIYIEKLRKGLYEVNYVWLEGQSDDVLVGVC